MLVVSTPVPRQPPEFHLEATDGARVLGRLVGHWLTPGLLHAEHVQVEAGAVASEVHDAFAGAFAEALGREGEILAWERPADAGWLAALERAGLAAARRKAYFERSLGEPLPTPLEGAVLRSLAAVGEAEFVARMGAASEGDPFEDRPGEARNLAREWHDLVEAAGADFDPTRWFLVDDREGPLGVVLPQTSYPGTGTLFYVGVVPGRRAQGMGRALHALGLHLLAQQGHSRYVGSTDVRNAAMLRIFERNGCRRKDIQVYYRPVAQRAGACALQSGRPQSTQAAQ